MTDNNNSKSKDLSAHWDRAYTKTPIDKLGWYESTPQQSLQLIAKCGLEKDACILNVGAGASNLIDALLEEGYTNLIANDISSAALKNLKHRLEDDQHKVRWIMDNLTNPSQLDKLEAIDLWHDRAVLHFFCDKNDQKTYFDLVRKIVKPGGYVIIAVFNLEGATKCSGLTVFRYNKEILQQGLGNDFNLIESFDNIYQMPSGDVRPYVYALFQRKDAVH
jgi:SAM-dependent methyltransferase